MISWSGGSGSGSGSEGARSRLGSTAAGAGGGRSGGGNLLPYSLSLATERIAATARTTGTAADNTAISADTGYSSDLAPVSGAAAVFTTAILSVYEKRVQGLISGCTHIHSVDQLATSLGDGADIDVTTTTSNSSGSSSESITHEHNMQDQKLIDAAVLCIWIDVDPDPQYGSPPFEPIARFFGIWHEHRRGAHKGLHEFYWENKYVLLLNTYMSRDAAQTQRQYQKQRHTSSGTTADTAGNGNKGGGGGGDGAGPPDYMSLLYAASTYKQLMPKEVPTLLPQHFNDQLMKKIHAKKAAVDMVLSGAKIVAAGKGGMSCDAVCSEYRSAAGSAHALTYKCQEDKLYLANTCHAMSTAFDCKSGCGEGLVGFGTEQPAYVVPEAPVQGGLHRPSACAISTNVLMATCEASYQYTRRLCVCVPSG